jgi:predicted MFS family arabinose efflux permease
VFALIRGNPEGWGSPLIVGLLIVAVVALVAFVLVERAGAHPMLDLTLFRNPTFGGASIAAFVLSATIFSMFLYLTLYVQNILGYSALEAGLRFLPATLMSFAVAPLSGKLAERHGTRWFMAGGLLLVAAGLWLMSGLEAGDDWTALLAGFLVAGGGIGLVNPALATTAVGVVDERRAGMASGINSTFRQVGIATGIAGLGALFQHFVASAFVAPAGLGARAPAGGEIADFISFGGAARSGNEALARAGEQAFVIGLNDLLHYAAVVALLGAIAVAALVRQRDFVARAVPA